MIPLSIPDLSLLEVENLTACVTENWVSSAGPAVVALEARFAELSARKHAVAVSSGTTALQLALLALGVGVGNTVVVPDFTFAATANAVVHCGATPYFCDITPLDLTLDPEVVDDLLTREAKPRRIKAVIAVDVIGQLADFERLAEVCRRHGVGLLADAAGSLGAAHGARPAGSFGDMATFSLNGNKVVTAGGGGVIVTDDADLARQVKGLSTQARDGRRYRHTAVGFNFRLPNLNAALAMAQLDRLDGMLEARRKIGQRYDDAILGINRPSLSLTPRRPGNVTNYWLYSVLCDSTAVADSLVDYLNDRGIEARHFWEQLSVQPPYRAYPAGANPVAASHSGRLVSLPSSSNLKPEEQARVIADLQAWLEARG